MIQYPIYVVNTRYNVLPTNPPQPPLDMNKQAIFTLWKFGAGCLTGYIGNSAAPFWKRLTLLLYYFGSHLLGVTNMAASRLLER